MEKMLEMTLCIELLSPSVDARTKGFLVIDMDGVTQLPLMISVKSER